ncbi:MAG: hypothetical protein GY807_06300, partial [Gammaproteobacteria bacterium]|nr:hypothetical protein [Gammaproteobacteria bacterium]
LDNGNGTITYTPEPGFTDSDSFDYQICDTGLLCDTATVNITVEDDQIIYAKSSSGGSVGGVDFDDDDILSFNTSTGMWSMFFDGSDVGLDANGQEINAFHIDVDGSVLLSLGTVGAIPDVGSVDDYDIVRFIPTSTGDTTAGSYELYFNGEDFGLDTASEDIDAIGFAPDGRLVVSTRGSYSAGGISGGDEDLILFDSGLWELYFDGSSVALDVSTEDVNGTSIDSNGDVYLSVSGVFNVAGLSGDESDIFVCTPGSTGPITSCTFSMFWDGSDPAYGFAGEVLNGFFVGSSNGGQSDVPPVAVDDSTITS